MGCFFACFASSKCSRTNYISPTPRNQSQEPARSLVPHEPSNKWVVKEQTVQLNTDPKEQKEERLNLGAKKKVAFDLNITTYEELPAQEVIDDLPEGEEENEDEEDEEAGKEGNSTMSDTALNQSSFGPKYRYQNCTCSDEEEFEVSEPEGSDADKDNNDLGSNEPSTQLNVIHEESSESLFSLSIDSRKHVCAAETEEKEVTSSSPIISLEQSQSNSSGFNNNMKVKSGGAQSVLNPVENLSEWKRAVKTGAATPLKNQEKENMTYEKDNVLVLPFSPEFTAKLPNCIPKLSPAPLKPLDKEIAVDTSLSSWLVDSENTPKSDTSTESVGNSPLGTAVTPRSADNRAILGVLPIENLRHFPASNSPKHSSSWIPDETPVIGTVGSYWSHTGQAIGLNSGSSCRVLTALRTKKEEERMNS